MSKRMSIFFFAAVGLILGLVVGQKHFAGSWIPIPFGASFGFLLGAIIHGESLLLLKLLRIVYVTAGGLILGWLLAEKYFAGSWVPVCLGGTLGFLLGASNFKVSGFWETPD